MGKTSEAVSVIENNWEWGLLRVALEDLSEKKCLVI